MSKYFKVGVFIDQRHGFPWRFILMKAPIEVGEGMEEVLKLNPGLSRWNSELRV